MAEDKSIIRFVALILIGTLFFISFILLKKIFLAILIGLLFSYIFKPVYSKLKKYLKSPNLATIALVLILLLLIAIPSWYLAPIFVKQTFETYKTLQDLELGTILHEVIPTLVTEENMRSITIQFNSLSSRVLSSLLNQVTDSLVNIPNIILQLAIVLFTFFFATRDSAKLKNYVFSLSPFSAKTTTKFSVEFRNITNVIIYGQLLIALIQGFLLGIGLLIFKAPSPLLLATLTVFTSIIPVLGSWPVWLPTSLYMILGGNVLSGGLLFVYGLVLVSSVDNFLRPYFLSKSSTLPLPVALIGTLGGLYAFGLIGLVLGPLILAYLLIVIDFYRTGRLAELFQD